MLKRLDNLQMQYLLLASSQKGYKQHQEQGNKAVKALAKMNRLHELPDMSSSSIALSLDHYDQSRIGDSLTLESSDQHQVTMGRSGGQLIHQLGPYTIGTGKTVKSVTKEILDAGMSSKQLAKAMHYHSFEDLKKAYPDMSDYLLGKVRALRHLIEVEKNRGPEVALHTSLEHRKSIHNYGLISSYADDTPLAPQGATTNLKDARKNKRNKKKRKRDVAFDYVPKETQKRSLASLKGFYEKYTEYPVLEDEEAYDLFEAVVQQDLNAEKPSDALINASRDVMRTPLHVWNEWEDDDVEEKKDNEEPMEEEDIDL